MNGLMDSGPVIPLLVSHFPSSANVNADMQGNLTSPTPAGRNGYSANNGNSLYQGHQVYAQTPHQSFGNSNHSYPTVNHQDRVSRVFQGHLPDRVVYGSDDTYGVKPQDQAPQAPQVYKSELPTPAPSDHNYGVENQATKPDDLQPPTKSSPNGADEEYDIDSQWMSELDPKVLDITSSNCTSQLEIQLIVVDPLPSSDIQDEEQPVTAEMIKQRNEEQKALEKKRKEEVSIKGRPATEIKEGQIAVEDIESEICLRVSTIEKLTGRRKIPHSLEVHTSQPGAESGLPCGM